MKINSTVFLMLFAFVIAASLSSISCKTKKKDLYSTKCGTCHKIYNPNKYSKKDWKINVDRMAPKAKLTDKETEAIIMLNTK